MTFDDTSCKPDQEFDLQPDHTGELEYATKSVSLRNICSVCIYFVQEYPVTLNGCVADSPRDGCTWYSSNSMVTCNLSFLIHSNHGLRVNLNTFSIYIQLELVYFPKAI